MDCAGGDLTAVRCCLCRWSSRCAQPVCAGCGRWPERPGGPEKPLISDESALEVFIHDDAQYKSTFFTLYLSVVIPILLQAQNALNILHLNLIKFGKIIINRAVLAPLGALGPQS